MTSSIRPGRTTESSDPTTPHRSRIPYSLNLTLKLLDSTFSICRASPSTSWEPPAGLEFVSITRSATELSVICDAHSAPTWPHASEGWRCLQVLEPHDVEQPGILLAVVQPISEAGISVFAVASFDTDHVLVPGRDLSQVMDLLTAAGHRCE
jgi:uncharacterized protein